MKKRFLTLFILFNLVLSGFSFAQDDIIIEVPETFEQAQQMGEEVLEIGKRDLPGVVKELWYGKVLPMWQKMYDWAYTNVWLKVKNFFGPRIEQEIEIRQEIIEQEFEQEKEEVKKELPGFLDRLWQFIRDVIHKIKLLWR
ncbi:MAG: hypothetical protein KJI70_00460 [Patescibacteria group bacterium]|nr:hypothetical protein [Patescibacteria group bacterium]